jgi:hypothetical protein
MPKSPEEHNAQYGHSHRRLRSKWRRAIAAGGVLCVRCGLEIVPGMPFDLDHNDDRKTYLGAAHQGCNRSAGVRRREAMRAGVVPRTRARARGAGMTEAEKYAWRAARGCPPEHDGGPDDVRRDADGVLHRKWGEW